MSIRLRIFTRLWKHTWVIGGICSTRPPWLRCQISSGSERDGMLRKCRLPRSLVRRACGASALWWNRQADPRRSLACKPRTLESCSRRKKYAAAGGFSRPTLDRESSPAGAFAAATRCALIHFRRWNYGGLEIRVLLQCGMRRACLLPVALHCLVKLLIVHGFLDSGDSVVVHGKVLINSSC